MLWPAAVWLDVCSAYLLLISWRLPVLILGQHKLSSIARLHAPRNGSHAMGLRRPVYSVQCMLMFL